MLRKKKNILPTERLEQTICSYFDSYIKDLYDKKVVILDGNFEKEMLGTSSKCYKELCNCVTTVIHCGANVRHYGKYDLFYKANVIRY